MFWGLECLFQCYRRAGRKDNLRGILRTVQIYNHLFYRRGIIAGLHREQLDSATLVSLVLLSLFQLLFHSFSSLTKENDCMIMSHDNVPHSSTSSKKPFTFPPYSTAITHNTTEQLPDHQVTGSLNTAAVVETNPFYSRPKDHSA